MIPDFILCRASSASASVSHGGFYTGMDESVSILHNEDGEIQSFEETNDSLQSSVKTVSGDKNDITDTADKLYDQYKIEELYDFLLPHKDSDDAELLWRLARATCNLAKISTDQHVKKALMYEAFGYAKKGLFINDKNHGCQQWCGMLMVFTGEFEALKDRIKNAFHIKEHFEKAINIKPDDATTMHSLGSWCFYFADMPWYQRQLAAALFAAPPVSTYEEALHYLLEAEKASPNFDTNNLLMLGKTYMRLKDDQKAFMYLKKAIDRTPVTEDDKQAQKEAISLLKNFGAFGKVEDSPIHS